jgi:putative redox protein
MDGQSDAPAARDAITRRYPAEGLVIEWRQGLCQHSGNCVRALPRVFNPRRQPWVETAGAEADAIRAAVARCPSGALAIGELGDGANGELSER